MAINVEAMAVNAEVMAINAKVIAVNIEAMAINAEVMANTIVCVGGKNPNGWGMEEAVFTWNGKDIERQCSSSSSLIPPKLFLCKSLWLCSHC